MPRQARNAPGGYVYHVINRANGRLRLFRKEQDFLAFERVLAEAVARRPTIRLLDWCVMSNHWHFVVWPTNDEDVTAFFRWLTHTHTQRWHAHHGTSGTGHVYQGRFKCFPIQRDEHLAQVLRYVQLNPVRAKVVKRASAWRWGSCHARRHGPAEVAGLLTDWPIAMPRDWDAWLDDGTTVDEATTERINGSIARGTPYGEERWVARTAVKLNLGSTLRLRGRPRKSADGQRPATADRRTPTRKPR